MPKQEEKIETILENIENNDIIKDDVIDGIDINEKLEDLQEEDIDKMQLKIQLHP